MNTYRTAPGNLQSRRGHVFELLRDSPQAVRHQTVAAMLAILLLLPAGCCRRGPASALHFSGAAPDRRLVRQVLLQFPAHFRRSIFATLHVSGHAFNVVGQWTVENSDHFSFAAVTEIGRLVVHFRQSGKKISIQQIAARFPRHSALRLCGDLHLILTGPVSAAADINQLQIQPHDTILRVSSRTGWRGKLYFSGTDGRLQFARWTQGRRVVTIRYRRYNSAGHPQRLILRDQQAHFSMTLDFTGELP